MKKLLKSKIAALCLVAVIVVVICVTFSHRTVWWMFADVFFAFMTAFTHLMALTVERMNVYSYRKLETAATLFGVLFVISFIVEFILGQTLF